MGSDGDCDCFQSYSEVPEIQSVFSFDSLNFSYKDALLMNKKSKKNTAASTSHPALLHALDRPALHQIMARDQLDKLNSDPRTKAPPPSTIREDGVGEQYDSFFLRDGQKDGRGGKSTQMFKNNKRSTRPLFAQKSRDKLDSRRSGRRHLKEYTSSMTRMH